jgi:heme a synthase
MKLQPAIVTAHLLGGVGLLALLTWLALREASRCRRSIRARSRLRPLAVLSALLLVVQIALGGWVSTNYAVLACPDFPAVPWPHRAAGHGFRAGFTLWRDLGMTADGAPIPFQALVAIHWTHRSFAYVVFAVLGLLAWRLWLARGWRSWRARWPHCWPCSS